MASTLSETRTDERPRERLLALGPGALTVVELVAIVIGVGTRGLDALAVAGQLMAAAGSLRAVIRRPAASWGAIAGMGRAKAARVAAALELAQRLAREDRAETLELRSPADVHRWCGPAMRDLVVEEFRVLALDTQHHVTRDLLITRGILNSSLVHPREVFRAAIAEAAAGVVLVHNHPSGSPAPSAEDRAVTAQLVAAGRLLDVPVYDHVIVGADRYFSFAEAGIL